MNPKGRYQISVCLGTACYVKGAADILAAVEKKLGIRPGSASEVLTKLEHNGLIRRSPNSADGRTMDISLTEEGQQQSLLARQQRIRRHDEMFACLSEEEKQELLALLGKLNGAWGERWGKQEGTP